MMRNAQATKSDGILRDPVASRVFERLAAILNDYADRRHLAIRRYQQNQPIWMFHFLHPKGGVGAIELAYSRLIDEAQGRLFVCAFWYCDDDEALTRHSHDPSAPEFMESDIDVVKLLAALEHQLAIVLAWDRSDLKRVSRISAGRPKDESGNPTSELEKRFRLPVIDG